LGFCDLKFAFRQLLKNPGFPAVAVLSFALGIVRLRFEPHRRDDHIGFRVVAVRL
jgi:hypothetical protein